MTYNLEDGLVPETNMPVRFYLTPNREDGSASILVAEPLDYETTRNFMLRVRAQNVAAVPLAAFTTVYVNLTGKITFISVWRKWQSNAKTRDDFKNDKVDNDKNGATFTAASISIFPLAIFISQT